VERGVACNARGARPAFHGGALLDDLEQPAVGALATIFFLVRLISIPDDFFFAGRGVGIWISLAAAVAVIVAGLLQAAEEL